MNKIDQAKDILRQFGLPERQQNDISALTFLALVGITKSMKWSQASNHRLGITKGIMVFIERNYKVYYQPNTRESIRKIALHYFLQTGIIQQNPDNPGIPTNSAKNVYAITDETLSVVKAYGTAAWEEQLKTYLSGSNKAKSLASKHRSLSKIPIKIEGVEFLLSPGKHNLLQAAIIQEFASRFAHNSQVVYVGDTAQKSLYTNTQLLDALSIQLSPHNKLPDILLYNSEKNWLFLIEAVSSGGPMSQKRINELNHLLEGCKAERVFVTAFSDRTEFRRHITDIAWETEVWIADDPDHLIHFNGDKFLGPYT